VTRCSSHVGPANSANFFDPPLPFAAAAEPPLRRDRGPRRSMATACRYTPLRAAASEAEEPATERTDVRTARAQSGPRQAHAGLVGFVSAALLFSSALACAVVLLLASGGVDLDNLGPVGNLFRGAVATPADQRQASDKQFSVDMRSAILLSDKSSEVALGIVKGRCYRARGPLTRLPRGEAAAEGSLQFWSSAKEHVVCFPSSGSSSDVHFVATLRDHGQAIDEGEFGFGLGVEVGLRPDIETSAVWPLQASVESLGLELKKDQAFHTLALKAKRADGEVDDMPLVIARPREQSAPMDVQAINQSLASCVLEPVAGASRFICVGRPEALGREVQFLALCGSCAGQASDWELSIGPTVGSEGVVASTSSAPWAGWVAKVPQDGGRQTWTATLWRRSRRLTSDAGAEDHRGEGTLRRLTSHSHAIAAKEVLDTFEEADRTFEIIFVAGDAQVPSSDTFADSDFVRTAGLGLQTVVVLMLIAVVGASFVAVKFLPGPVLAGLPSASTALGALQFLVLLGSSEVAPPQLRVLQEPLAWLVPTEPGTAVSFGLIVLIAVAILHGLAVLQHLAKNGKSSGEFLPHGLLFGAWELRALSLVALPLAAAGSELATRGYSRMTAAPAASDEGGQVSSEGGISELILGGVLLTGILAVSIGTWSRVASLLAEERVVAVELPDHEGTIFVDRVCDQLRAMPVAPGHSPLFGTWSASSGWCCAPAVAAIREVEHTGQPPFGIGVGSWRTTWPQGPWGTHKPTGKTPDEVAAAEGFGRSGSSLSYGRSTSMLSKGFSRAGSMASVDEAAAQYERGLSPVVASHSVTAQVRFAYKSSEKGPIAGVVGLPWLDAALPANTLRILQFIYREDDIKLCAHVGQLSGPLTSGRLSACFDWHDRCPYRWPGDLFMKLSLGVYAGALPFIASTLHSSGSIIHATIILGTLLFALAAPIIRPHVHALDNLALSSALASVAVGAACGQYFLDQTLVGTRALVGTLVVLAAIPVGLSAASCILVALFARRLWKQERPASTEDAVKEWGSSANEAYDRTFATAIVTMPAETYGLSQELKVELPVSTLVVPVHIQIKVQSAPSVLRALPADRRHPALSLPADLLLVPAGPATYEPKAEHPCVALLTPGGVKLLYANSVYNGDLTWQEAVHEFFGQQHRELAQAAIRAIQEHGSRHGDGALVTIEIVGSV